MNDAADAVIALVAPGALGLAAFVAGGVWLMRSLHARVRGRLAEEGAAVPMRCGSCGARFDMPAAEVASERFTHAPRRQVDAGVIGPAVIGGVPAAAGAERAVRAERFYECPACRERAWLRAEDPGRFYDALRPAAGEGARMLLLVPWGLACLALAAAASALLKLAL